jgi:hypothetical protein
VSSENAPITFSKEGKYKGLSIISGTGAAICTAIAIV